MHKIFLPIFGLINTLFASELCIFNEDGQLLQLVANSTEITYMLEEIGVRFEQWSTDVKFESSATESDVLLAYKDDIFRLQQEEGFQSVDVLRMLPDNPQKDTLRAKFLREHTHNEPEIRFFVEGSGLFYLHVQDEIYRVQCEQGDLISVPAEAPHWFDMGTEPRFTAIRFFTRPDGWVAQYTE